MRRRRRGVGGSLSGGCLGGGETFRVISTLYQVTYLGE